MTTLYSNYYSEDRFDEAKQYLFDERAEENNWTSTDDVPDSQVWDEMSFQDELNWEDFEYEMNLFLDKHEQWIAVGTCGLWTGRHAAGTIFTTFGELSKAWRDCDYIEFTDENGHLILNCSHHDGTNSFEIKRLTKKGCEYAENHYYDDDREVHTKIFNSNFYSALPHFARDCYGCKETA